MANTQDRMMAVLGNRFSRRGVLKGSVAMSAGAFVAATLGISASNQFAAAAPPLDTDLMILNYALTLEHLESAAYKAINSAGVLTGAAATYFQSFGMHETTHVDALTATIKQLGGTPVSPSNYNFSSVPKDAAGIVMFFQGVEAVGASAYLGAAGSIKNFDVLEAALSIHAVEAEHASALAYLVSPGSDLFAPEAFATPRTPDQVMQIVAPFFTAMAAAPAAPAATTAPAATARPAAPAAPAATTAPAATAVMPAALPRTGGGFASGYGIAGPLNPGGYNSDARDDR